MNRFERHPKRVLALLVLAALVALIAGAEAVLRQTLDLAITAPGLGSLTPYRFIAMREWQPGIKFRATPPPSRLAHPGGKVLDVYAMDVDADGFIMPSRVHADPDITIVFLGGSTTECMYVSPDQRFAYLAGRLLEKRLGLKVNSLNGGRSGDHAMHANAIMLGKVLPMHADYVVFMTATNDVATLTRYGTYWNDSTDYGVLRNERTGAAWGLGLVRNALIPGIYRAWRLTGLELRAWRESLFPPAPAAPPALAPAATAADAARWEPLGAQYGMAAQLFVDIARAGQTRPVLMTEALQSPEGAKQPGAPADFFAEANLAGGGFSAKGFGDAHEYFNGVLREVARRTNATLIDLMAAGPWTEADIYDGLHFNDAGSARAAAIIADALEPMIRADRAAAGKRP